MKQNKEILMVVEAVSNEKGIAKETIFQAIEAALASTAKKRNREDIVVRVSVDRETGNYTTFRCWEVLDDDTLELPHVASRQMLLNVAREKDPNIQVGDHIEEPMPSVEFGRIEARIAKQVIVQKVREAERVQIVDSYKDQVGEMLGGFVKQVERNGVTLDLGGNAEGFIPASEMIPRESVRAGDRIRAYLKEVVPKKQGPQLFMSRTAKELLIKLLKIEVPEINEGLIDIVNGARDPGVRAKVAVKTNDPRVDPIGACVGMHGSRVQAISNELAGERVDIILWEEDAAQYVINAMAPAEAVSIMVDETAESIDVVVAEENLSQAIGRGGQNVRLASELTQWEINVMSVTQAEEKNEVEAGRLQAVFMGQLGVDEEIAIILVQEGFSSIEEVAYVPEQEMLNIEEFDSELVAELRGRARDALLTQAIADEEKLADVKPADDLLNMNGMNRELAYKLAGCGIATMEDLATKSVDELLNIEDLGEDRAGELIMTARKPWFETEPVNDG